MSKTAIIWFRQDLRLTDNPALIHALQNGYDIVPLYILDDDNADDWAMGGASRWWLHHSLQSLNKSLGGNLVIRNGDAAQIIPKLIKDIKVDAIFWNRCYEPWRIKRDKSIKESLEIETQSFNASLLWEPWEPMKPDGTPYKVFTPFYRKGCLGHSQPAETQSAPKDISYAAFDARGDIDDLKLLPDISWDAGFKDYWQPGEDGARACLKSFLGNGLSGYKENRNRPDDEHSTSRLSPHLHFGEISPRQCWHDARAVQAAGDAPENDVDHFCSELGWREFSYTQLYHQPHITWENLQEKFNIFPWNAQRDSKDLKAWQKGQTGIPIVDAAMRQLWQTGWMHNRCRMIVGSLLVKNLMIHWHRGEEWFWDCLIDADLANNAASWQWIAGCGADAAPYFRIFNPVTQGEKFDPDGDYVREFVPELKDMPAKYIHSPWDAPNDVLQKAGVTLGDTYPAPIVDLKKSRQRALDAFTSLKDAA